MRFSSWVVVSPAFSWVAVFVAWPFCLSFCFSARLSDLLAGASPADRHKMDYCCVHYLRVHSFRAILIPV